MVTVTVPESFEICVLPNKNINIVINSVTGIVAQTPMIPNKYDNKYNNGITNRIALHNDSKNDFNDWVFEAKIDVVTVFAPIKTRQR